ncbi:ATP-grasp domain-containing protein [Longispora sp. NPDC051575]|uniref:ATP-grasp domain-containing protein n=1 Tax=Longispora sp. NPDC051575 TaxID=3154943 RepID=UPI0034197730
MSTGPVVVVGFVVALLKTMETFQPADSVIFVDEPDVFRKKDAAPKVADARCVADTIEFEYFNLPAAADEFFHRYRDLNPSMVIPAVDYAVPFAARLAERYGVAGATYGAAALLRDKELLRLVARAAGIANPASVPVAGPDEVRAFMAAHPGPAILKPANRQAAIGTRILAESAEIDAGWTNCLDQDEGIATPDRAIPLRMLVEEYVKGEEFSVEMVLRGGAPLFANVTGKALIPGPKPVENGHIVPADIPAELTAALNAETVRLMDAVGFDTGFVHCEWIVRDGTIYLVECAGRMPGDMIMDLIREAWSFNMVEYYFQVMRDETPSREVPAEAPAGAAIWFLHTEPGEVLSVDGLDEAREQPGVLQVDMLVQPGGRVHELRSSWDRAGLAVARGESPATALAAAQDAIDTLKVKFV